MSSVKLPLRANSAPAYTHELKHAREALKSQKPLTVQVGAVRKRVRTQQGFQQGTRRTQASLAFAAAPSFGRQAQLTTDSAGKFVL